MISFRITARWPPPNSTVNKKVVAFVYPLHAVPMLRQNVRLHSTDHLRPTAPSAPQASAAGRVPHMQGAHTPRKCNGKRANHAHPPKPPMEFGTLLNGRSGSWQIIVQGASLCLHQSASSTEDGQHCTSGKGKHIENQYTNAKTRLYRNA